MVVAMARNGTEFGIQVSGTGDEWFTAPAPMVEGLFLPGFGPEDANPDLGDSTITETTGIGGFAMAAAPAIVRFVGGDVASALANSRRMYEITVTEHPLYQIPALGFRGTPDRHRRHPGGAHRGPAHHQHRDRRSRARHRPGRCRAGVPTSHRLRRCRAFTGRTHQQGGLMSSIIAADFRYVRPRVHEELLEILATRDGVQILAGGTDLLVDLRNGTKHPRTLVDVKGVDGYRDIVWDEDTGLSIGSSATINDLLYHPDVREHYPLLVACAADLASHQIRNRATVVGNVVNASPVRRHGAGPAVPHERPRSSPPREGERTVPFSEFFTGVKRTVLTPRRGPRADRRCPPRPPVPAADYRKLKRIKGHDLGIVGRRGLEEGRRRARRGQLLALRPRSSSRACRSAGVDRRHGRRGRSAVDQPDQRRAVHRGVPRPTWSTCSSAELLQEVA